MANINKIKLSGTTYNIQDLSAAKTVELTQAQYDTLVSGGTVDPNTFYVITDAQGADLSNYYTKSETSGATQISTALASKQTTLTAGTGIDITDNVISATGGGGSITIDPSLDSGSTNPVANSAITNTVGKYYYAYKFDNSPYGSPWGSVSSNGCVGTSLVFKNIVDNSEVNSFLWFSRINDKSIFYNNNNPPNANYFNLNLVETSAITTSISSGSTDSQVPSAKAVYDQLGGLKLVKLTQSAYDALSPNYDSNTLYIIKD